MWELLAQMAVPLLFSPLCTCDHCHDKQLQQADSQMLSFSCHHSGGSQRPGTELVLHAGPVQPNGLSIIGSTRKRGPKDTLWACRDPEGGGLCPALSGFSGEFYSDRDSLKCSGTVPRMFIFRAAALCQSQRQVASPSPW